MALVMMTMLFMLSERLRMKNQCPLLSCADIERLLAAFLPRRDASPEQVLSHMRRRHLIRRRAIESHTKRKRRGDLKFNRLERLGRAERESPGYRIPEESQLAGQTSWLFQAIRLTSN